MKQTKMHLDLCYHQKYPDPIFRSCCSIQHHIRVAYVVVTYGDEGDDAYWM